MTLLNFLTGAKEQHNTHHVFELSNLKDNLTGFGRSAASNIFLDNEHHMDTMVLKAYLLQVLRPCK